MRRVILIAISVLATTEGACAPARLAAAPDDCPSTGRPRARPCVAQPVESMSRYRAPERNAAVDRALGPQANRPL
jgi:hypothetical protein